MVFQKILNKDQFQFYFRTWTGRILLINFLLFVLITISSGSFFSPDGRVLIAWGAKDPVGIAKGEWWRFVSPIFLHFGVLHFFLNSLALKVVGTYLEPMLGALWFLVIYLGSGIAGNVLSTLTNVSVGAGASGAIFGLIGVGMVIEQIIIRKEGSKSRMGPFTYMAIINIIFAVLFNFIFYIADGGRIGIDNSAHLGGLVGGMLLGTAMLFLRSNRLLPKNVLVGSVLICVLASGIAAGAYFSIFTPQIYHQLLKEAENSTELGRSYYYYTQAISIDASDPSIRFKRGRVLVLLGELHYAMQDLLYCSTFRALEDDFKKLHEELLSAGRSEDAAAISLIIDHMDLQQI